jgi:hypothetical protein
MYHDLKMSMGQRKAEQKTMTATTRFEQTSNDIVLKLIKVAVHYSSVISLKNVSTLI